MNKFLISAAFIAAFVLVLAGCKEESSDEKDFIITKTLIDLTVGSKTQIEVTPATGTYSFESTDPSIATVSETGLVTAGMDEGSVMINVRMDGITKRVIVNVLALQFTISNSTINLTIGNSAQIVVTPANVTYSFESKSPSVATVNSTGLVTAVGLGIATINVSYGKTVKEVTVNVSDVSRPVVTIDISTFTDAEGALGWSGGVQKDIEFEEDCEIIFTGLTPEQIATAYNRDFMSYDAGAGELIFIGEPGVWNVIWSEKYNYLWVLKRNDTYPACYWIVGHGFSSAAQWHGDFGDIGWSLDDFRQLAYMRSIGEGKYQATVYLNPYHNWWTCVFGIYGNRNWGNKIVPQSFTGDNAGCTLDENTDVYMDRYGGFVDGYYRLTIDTNSKELDLKRLNP